MNISYYGLLSFALLFIILRWPTDDIYDNVPLHQELGRICLGFLVLALASFASFGITLPIVYYTDDCRVFGCVDTISWIPFDFDGILLTTWFILVIIQHRKVRAKLVRAELAKIARENASLQSDITVKFNVFSVSYVWLLTLLILWMLTGVAVVGSPLIVVGGVATTVVGMMCMVEPRFELCTLGLVSALTALCYSFLCLILACIPRLISEDRAFLGVNLLYSSILLVICLGMVWRIWSAQPVSERGFFRGSSGPLGLHFYNWNQCEPPPEPDMFLAMCNELQARSATTDSCVLALTDP